MNQYVVELDARVSLADRQGDPMPGAMRAPKALRLYVKAKDEAEAAEKIATAINDAAHRAVPGIDLT